MTRHISMWSHVTVLVAIIIITITSTSSSSSSPSFVKADYTTVTFLQCDGIYCSANCTPTTFPVAKCAPNPENSSSPQSYLFSCVSQPEQMCFTEYFYRPSSTSCDDSSISRTYNWRCNHCMTNEGGNGGAGGGSGAIYVCAADGSNITFRGDCDSNCKNCAYSQVYKVKQCIVGAGTRRMNQYGAPFRCPVTVHGMEWTNSSSCSGSEPMKFSHGTGVCNAATGPKGTMTSTKTICS